MNKLELTSVSKHYGQKQALDNLSITFTDGICGLLGPNGAGKSTLMNIITQNIGCDKSELTMHGTTACSSGAASDRSCVKSPFS